jgi:translation elongation factor EF-1alpha
VDSPGHWDFMKTAIRSIVLADVVVLVVSGMSGEYEDGMSAKGLTRKNLLYAFSMGVQRFIICINKTDENSFNYS